MSIPVEELWTQTDEWSLDLFVGAAAQDDLARALLALEGADSAVRQRSEQLLAFWASLLPRQMGLRDAPEEQAFQLGALLVGEMDLRGDQVDYTHPVNSQLSQVLERRRGLPILLSVVWMEVGRRAGIPVEGIGLPGHFIVRVGGEAGEYVDPFSGGDSWSVEDCRRKSGEITGGQIPWTDSFLEPLDSQELLRRVCRNLVGAHGQRRDGAPLYRALRFLEAMSPDDPEVPLLRARVAERHHAFPRALKIYRALAERYGDTEAGLAASARLKELALLHVAEG